MTSELDFPPDDPRDDPALASQRVIAQELYTKGSRWNKPASAKRELPHSDEAESSLIACCLIDGETALARCRAAGISAASFYDDDNSFIFSRILAIHDRGDPVDTSVLAEDLRDLKRLDDVGGYAGVAALTSRTPSTLSFGFFVEKVREQALRRAIIREGTSIVDETYGLNGAEPHEVDLFAKEVLGRMSRTVGGADQTKSLARTPLTAFTVPPKDDRSVLLGNRYLNRGDGGIIVSSSGMGKSSLYVLAAVMWALGRDFFGIKPNGPLRSLLVQSEDSDGDVAEVWFSILSALKLTPAQIQEVTDRVVIVTDRIHRGAPFIAELKRHIAAFKPDIVWINPLVAFIDGDVKEAADAGSFLREGLNGLNADAQFGYIIIHHTTKPPNAAETKERNWSEVMYDMAGSYDLIGWARFIISLRPTPKPGDFNMVLAKRGRRAGVTRAREQGVGHVDEVTTTIPLRHSTDRITLPTGDEIFSLMWHTRDPDAQGEVSAGKPKVHHWSKVAEFVPFGEANMKGVGEIARAAEQTGVARNSIRGVLDEAYNDGVVQRRVVNTVLKYWR